MRAGLDRWVLPPAVGAALCAVLAATPPVGTAGEALRIEALAAPSEGPWLLRVAVESPDTGVIRAPARATLTVGGRTETARGDSDGLYAWATLRPPTGARVLQVRAAGHRAELTVAPFALAVGAASRPAGVLDVRVPGESLISERAGVVLVRAVGATSVAMEPEGEGVTVVPPRALADGCGVARFEVRVDALGAGVHVVASPQGLETRVRLPVRPGGVALAWTHHDVEAFSTSGASEAFLVAGDARGATGWTESGWVADGDAHRLAWAVAPGSLWVVASSAPDFSEPAGLWRVDGATPAACASSEGSRGWFSNDRVLPEIPAPRVIFDGVARQASGRDLRRERLRAVGFAGLAVCVLIEAALVLSAGLSTGPDALAGVSDTRRARAGLIALAVLLLSLAGLALAVAGLLRASDAQSFVPGWDGRPQSIVSSARVV